MKGSTVGPSAGMACQWVLPWLATSQGKCPRCYGTSSMGHGGYVRWASPLTCLVDVPAPRSGSTAEERLYKLTGAHTIQLVKNLSPQNNCTSEYLE